MVLRNPFFENLTFGLIYFVFYLLVLGFFGDPCSFSEVAVSDEACDTHGSVVSGDPSGSVASHEVLRTPL